MGYFTETMALFESNGDAEKDKPAKDNDYRVPISIYGERDRLKKILDQKKEENKAPISSHKESFEEAFVGIIL